MRKRRPVVDGEYGRGGSPAACTIYLLFALALYELQDATLAGIDGQGYAFPIDTFQGKQYRGVFFANDAADLQPLSDADDVTFEGTVYHKTTQGEDALSVDVQNVVSVGIGTRADFHVV